MSQTPENPANVPDTTHAQGWLNSTAHSLGYFWGSTRLRLQSVTKAGHEKATQKEIPRAEHEEHTENQEASSTSQTQQPESTATEQQQPAHAATHRAEEMTDNLGQRLGAVATDTNRFVRRATARVREGAEDIWAESQTIRQKNTLTK
ncbi:MAG TPA: hypothetical protein VHZ51_31675 [Ktedonobacteraceae bacterium]|jgi:hypothetical protein|nr:hypothetical protein [Ktedonobacteraceae bacterium]